MNGGRIARFTYTYLSENICPCKQRGKRKLGWPCNGFYRWSVPQQLTLFRTFRSWMAAKIRTSYETTKYYCHTSMEKIATIVESVKQCDRCFGWRQLRPNWEPTFQAVTNSISPDKVSELEHRGKANLFREFCIGNLNNEMFTNTRQLYRHTR